MCSVVIDRSIESTALLETLLYSVWNACIMYLKPLVPPTCFDYSVWLTVLTRERVRGTAVHCWMMMGDSAR